MAVGARLLSGYEDEGNENVYSPRWNAAFLPSFLPSSLPFGGAIQVNTSRFLRLEVLMSFLGL